MQKQVIVLLSVICVAAALTFPTELVGGWTNVQDCSSPLGLKSPLDLLTLVGGKYATLSSKTKVKMVAARIQLVAGTNYAAVFHISDKKTSEYVGVEAFISFDGKVNITKKYTKKSFKDVLTCLGFDLTCIVKLHCEFKVPKKSCKKSGKKSHRLLKKSSP